MTSPKALTEPLLVFDDQEPARLSELDPTHPLVLAIGTVASEASTNIANQTLEIAAQQASIAVTLNQTSAATLSAAQTAQTSATASAATATTQATNAAASATSASSSAGTATTQATNAATSATNAAASATSASGSASTATTKAAAASTSATAAATSATNAANSATAASTSATNAAASAATATTEAVAATTQATNAANSATAAATSATSASGSAATSTTQATNAAASAAAAATSASAAAVAVNGILNVSVVGGLTLSGSQAGNGIHIYTGALTTNTTVTLPMSAHPFTAYNKTTGAFTLTIAATGGSASIVVPQGQTMALVCDGSTGILPQDNGTIPAAIAKGSATSTGALTGTETFPASRGSGLLQATSAQIATLAQAPIANGTATSAGALTGTETLPASRAAGLLQTTAGAIATLAQAPIANGSSTDAGTLTGTETLPASRGAGLLQTTLTKIATFVLSIFTILIGSATGLIGRTIVAELLDLPVSVKRFGAKGDGVTDDTAEILAAAAATVGTVFFPPGNYKVSGSPATILASQHQWDGPGFLLLGADTLPVARVVEASFSMSIPANFTNAGSCLWYLQNRFLADGVTVTCNIANGTYTWPQTFMQHPQGQRIQFIGNVNSPSSVVLQFDATNFNSCFQASGVYTLGLINGVTIQASNAWNSHGNWNAAITPYGAGILAQYGGSINVGAAVIVTKCYYGIKATYGGTINCAPGVSVTEAGDAAYHAFHDGSINALGCSAQGTYDSAFSIGYGFLGEMGGTIHAENATSSYNFLHGFAGLSTGSVWAQKSSSHNNNQGGYFAQEGGHVNASSPSWVTGSATVSNANRWGARAEKGGTVEFVGSTASNNTSDGLSANGGVIVADSATSTGNTGAGQVARNNGLLYGAATSTSNGVSDFIQTGGIMNASTS